MRLARKTSPWEKGRPFRQMTNKITKISSAMPPSANHAHSGTTTSLTYTFSIFLRCVPTFVPLYRHCQDVRLRTMPYRHPGAPGPRGALSGKPITFYRPKGSKEVRHLIDEGFQAFNAARLSEACRIFSEKLVAPDEDTTMGLTIRGAVTPRAR